MREHDEIVKDIKSILEGEIRRYIIEERNKMNLELGAGLQLTRGFGGILKLVQYSLYSLIHHRLDQRRQNNGVALQVSSCTHPN